ESRPVRHVGFATIEQSTATATLCLEVARALAAEDRYDVGLIDAYPDSVPLETQLQIPPPTLRWPPGRSHLGCGWFLARAGYRTPAGGALPIGTYRGSANPRRGSTFSFC